MELIIPKPQTLYQLRKNKNFVKNSFWKYLDKLIINLIKPFRKINELRHTIIIKSLLIISQIQQYCRLFESTPQRSQSRSYKDVIAERLLLSNPRKKVFSHFCQYYG